MPPSGGGGRRPFGSSVKHSLAAKPLRSSCLTKPIAQAHCSFWARTTSIWDQPATWGPVDPQFLLADGSLGAARAIIAAVEDAETRIQANPQTYPLHAALLADISALMVQQARDALARTTDQVTEALSCVRTRTRDDVATLAQKLHGPLIGETQSHGTTISAKDARSFDLPVREAAHDDQQWRDVWRLWMKYRVLGEAQVYEGQNASVVMLRGVVE